MKRKYENKDVWTLRVLRQSYLHYRKMVLKKHNQIGALGSIINGSMYNDIPMPEEQDLILDIEMPNFEERKIMRIKEKFKPKNKPKLDAEDEERPKNKKHIPSEEQIQDILARYKDGDTADQIAFETNISKQMVVNVILGLDLNRC